MTSDTPARLPISTMVAYSAPNVAMGAMSVAVFVYLPAYFAGHLGVSLAVVGGVWMGIRLIDLPIDWLIGLAMDRTRTRIGRYKPWALAAAPVLALGIWQLFMAPKGFGVAYLGPWLLFMYLGYSGAWLSMQALGASLAAHYDDRSKLFAVQAAMGVMGVLAALSLPIVGKPYGLSDADAVRGMGVFIVVAAPLGIALAALLVKEVVIELPRGARGSPLSAYLAVLREPASVRLFLAQFCVTLGPGWMSALYLFYFRQVRHYSTESASILLAVYILAGLPGAALGSFLSQRIGKHRALMAMCAGFSISLPSVLFIPLGAVWAAVPFMLWAGAMASAFGLIIQAMLADVGDKLRLDHDREQMSLVYAMNTSAAKIAAAFSIGLTFPLLQVLGFNPVEGVRNTPEALDRLQWAFLSGPVVFVILGGVCVVGWRLDAARHADIRAQLEARDRLTTGLVAPAE